MKNKIARIIVTRDESGSFQDVVFFFEDDALHDGNREHGLNEFVAGTRTRKSMEKIWEAIKECEE